MTRRQKDLFPELSDGKKYVSDIPELMAEWHPTRNQGLMPEDITCGSNTKAWWFCSKGHEWQQRGYAVVKNTGEPCPRCRFPSMSDTDPLMAAAFHPTLNGEIRPSDISAGTGKRYWWQCANDTAHVWHTTGSNLKKASRPDLCPDRRRKLK